MSFSFPISKGFKKVENDSGVTTTIIPVGIGI